jgi:hypothetical protein
MYLTQHELTAASSVVAALAILGGHLGVRSANRNALKIASEERSSRYQSELGALKRVTYARLLTALDSLASASQQQEKVIANEEIRGGERITAIRRREEALTTALNIIAEFELFAPDALCKIASEALQGASTCTRESSHEFTSKAARLRIAMRRDLQSIEIPSPEELDRLAIRSLG